MRGRVFNRCGNEYLPVYKARVHICEVDPVIWYIQKLPDYEMMKLRDDILGKIIHWHLPDPAPDPFKNINVQMQFTNCINTNKCVAENIRSKQFDKESVTRMPIALLLLQHCHMKILHHFILILSIL